VHPFWSSHEEKRACVRLSMGGGYDRSWTFHGSHGELVGERKEGEGGGRRQRRGWGAARGAMGL
jgi:hypothetical protein